MSGCFGERIGSSGGGDTVEVVDADAAVEVFDADAAVETDADTAVGTDSDLAPETRDTTIAETTDTDVATEPDLPADLDTTATPDLAEDSALPPEAETAAPYCGDGRCDPDERCPECADCPCPERCGADLFLSEYVEGTSWNKALEIANFTGHEVELAGYAIWKITNGGPWSEGASRALSLSGTLAHGAALVVCHGDAAQPIAEVCQLASTADALEFNGDDALALVRNGAIIDVVGLEGDDPGSGWAIGPVSNATADHTLRRKLDVVDGSDDWALAATTWDVLGKDDFADLGRFTVTATCTASDPPRAALNEIAAASDGSDFVEIAAFPVFQSATLDLAGWAIATTGGRYTFPAGATMARGGFLALSEGVLGFSLGLNDRVWLYDAEGALQDVIGWGVDDLRGASYGRLPDLTGALVPNSVATPGAPNQSPETWCGDRTCQVDEDCVLCPSDCAACQPGPGDLVISEIMAEPTAGPEWFELVNVAGVPLELSGVTVRDEHQDLHVVAPDTSLVLEAGALLVMSSDTMPLAAGELYVLSGVTLDPDDDALILERDRVLIDRVGWSHGVGPGVARNLGALATDADDNDDDEAWCTTLDGTPGAPNPVCPRCGDLFCQDAAGETCETCAEDCGRCPVIGCAEGLFFSEYVEGSSFNKAIEIANFTGAEVDLAGYQIWRLTNGQSTWDALPESSKVALIGTLAHGAVWVGCNTRSVESLLTHCDAVFGQGSAPTNFNGDDALALTFEGVIIDVIGFDAVDPGDGWSIAGVPDATLDHTLTRAPHIMRGNTDWAEAALDEWLVGPPDAFEDLGAHTVDYLCSP